MATAVFQSKSAVRSAITAAIYWHSAAWLLTHNTADFFGVFFPPTRRFTARIPESDAANANPAAPTAAIPSILQPRSW